MRKSLLAYLSLALIPGLALAQNFLGTQGFSYGGVFSLQTQPAEVADSRMMFDIGLGGFSSTVYNNYISVDGRNAAFGNTPIPNSQSWRSDVFQRNLKNDRKYYGYTNADIYMPLSFMITTSKKSGIGFQSRLRTFTNIDQVDGELINGAHNQFQNPIFWNNTIMSERLRVNSAAYLEYAGTYGRVIMDNGRNFMKVGVTGKLLQGVGMDYNYVNAYSMRVLSDTTANISIMNIDRGGGTNIRRLPTPVLQRDSLRAFADTIMRLPVSGFGWDVGVVYEYRPRISDYEYEANGKKGRIRYDNKYKWKVGVSVTDLGRFSVKRLTQTENLAASNLDIRYNNQDQKDFFDYLDDFSSNSQVNVTRKDSVKIRMSLPVAVNLQADYRVSKQLYVHALYQYSPKFYNAQRHLHGLSSLTVTPRYEQMYFTSALPITIDQNFNMNVGLAGSSSVIPIPKIEKFFPIHIVTGSSNLLSAPFKKKNKGIDMYFGIHVMIPFRNNDIDHDGTINRKDKCVEQPGPKEFKGCPDADGDKVPDKDDECPTTPGLITLKGCPDRDKDKIPDAKDECPDQRGPAKLNGCPDKDGDQVPDHKDECPDVRGKVELKGCPDKDNDGVADKDDKCPTEKGTVAAQGCPDKDNDSVADKDDKCPNDKGSASAQGCPDEDNDGVMDKDDKCPSLAGTSKAKGCPDKDDDSIADSDDACPEEAGTSKAKGCPDKDNDGTADKDDACPDKAGTGDNNGCPPGTDSQGKDKENNSSDDTGKDNQNGGNDKPGSTPYPSDPKADRDGDGIPDRVDTCPDVSGSPANGGCPKVNAPDFIVRLFDVIEFDVAKAEIRPQYHETLEEIAFQLKANPGIKLYIMGNTDSDGDFAYNERLSIRRAEAIKAYLVARGVPSSHLKTQGFGEMRPKADNNTPENKQRNRRVEVEIWNGK